VVVIFWFYFCLPQLVDLRLSAFATGTLALGLSAGAFLSEIFRAGIEAVPRGQHDAAQALGLSRLPLWTLIILPQAVRPMVPAFVNYLTELLKHSTLLSAIGVGELAHAAFTMGGQTFRYFEFFTAIGFIFFVMIFHLSLYGRYLNQGHSAGR
jgi:ABC-type amino acid transport system permease subunit